MHSDYLNENKICEFFQDEDEDFPKRDNEVSLNLTVTSRDTRNQPNQTALSSSNLNNNHGITLAVKELDKFNKWAQNFHSKNEKLMDDVTNLVSSLETDQSSNILLSMVDFDMLERKCKNPKTSSVKKRKETEECLQCKKKKQLIQIINEQHQIKIDECIELKKKLDQVELSLQKQIEYGLSEKLGREVEINLLNVALEDLKVQILQLRTELDRNKLLEKSNYSVNKSSNSLLKTKVDLERSTTSGYIPQANLTSNSNLRYSFSNMKSSAKLTNPNDTMNRINSLISFENCEPSFDELIRYFEDEAGLMKSKVIQMTHEEKKINKKVDGLEKKRSITEYPEKKLYKCYSEICKYLTEIKMEKDRYGDRLSSSSNLSLQRLNERSKSNSNININTSMNKLETTNGCTSNLQNTSTTIISPFEYRELKNTLKCYQSELNNLKDTNQDLVCELRQVEDIYREKMAECEMKNKQLKKFEQEWKILSQKFLRESRERKRISHSLQDLKGKVRIYCRIRPKMKHQEKYRCPITYNYKKIVIEGNKEYQFDHVFGDRASQSDVFQEIKTVVECAMDGKNICVMTYGQRGSGKTYTLHGNSQHPGLFPQLTRQLFELIDRQKKYYDTSIKMNILEIQRESIKDLLKNFQDSDSEKVDIKEDKNGIHLINSVIIKCTNLQEILQAYNGASQQKMHYQGDLSQEGCRSHHVIILYLALRNKKTKEEKYSKISFVELASAERISTSNALASKEAQLMNKSLMNLVGAVGSLNMNSQNISYRDSKLTHLLKDSLNLHSKILMFVNISPSQYNMGETLNSLKYGQRAKGLQKMPSKKKQRKQENNENSISQYIVIPRRSSSRLSVS